MFIGPPASAIRLMGDKVEARKAAAAAGVPLVPGLQENVSEDELARRADEIGYPVMLKAAAGGAARASGSCATPIFGPSSLSLFSVSGNSLAKASPR